MQNKDIRNLIETSNMKYWQVAHKLGIADSTFSRKLRFELSKEEKEKIKEIIKNNKED